MRQTADRWYLRFPDGQMRRAVGATIIRQQLASGRIPPGTYVRRSRDEEWRPLERFAEFADLATSRGNGVSPQPDPRDEPGPAPIASRVDPTQLNQVGIRGLLEELLAAVDGAAVWRKVFVAGTAGGLLGGLGGLLVLDVLSFLPLPVAPGVVLVLGMLLVFAWLSGLLTRLTFLELSRLRPARLAAGLRGNTGFMFRFVLLQGGALLLLGGLVAAARWLPRFLLESTGEEVGVWQLIGAQAVAVAGVLAEACVWPIAILLLPLGPLLIVEECSAFRGLARWVVLVRRHFGRLLLAEGMALAVGLILSMPLGLLVLALHASAPDLRLQLAVALTRFVVTGMAGGLLLGYLIVANVFIYLHLRYEWTRVG